MIKSIPYYVLNYKRFWKIYFHKAGLIEYPLIYGKRGSKAIFKLRERDKWIFNEFYFVDGYDDLNIEEFDKVVDVGANIGLFSVESSYMVDEVIAFEANPRT